MHFRQLEIQNDHMNGRQYVTIFFSRNSVLNCKQRMDFKYWSAIVRLNHLNHRVCSIHIKNTFII